MPTMTTEKLDARAKRLKNKLATKGSSLDATKVRAIEKQIRRAQRRRRKMAATAARAAGKAAKKSE